MNKKNIDEKNFKPLDSFEEKLMEDIEKDNFVSSNDLDGVKEFFSKAVKNYKSMQGSRRITVRVDNGDLIRLKAKAKEEGIPYQTLLGSVIHKFVAG